MTSPTKRRDMDVMKLMMSDYQVQMAEGSMCDFFVRFVGPKDSLYDKGVWKVHVELPEAYPYKSPSIGFCNRMYHPNVDEMSGSVCLDVINQTWSPMFDLINIFEVFLPQLLLYPNASDPLNGEAASLMARDPERYHQKVKEYVEKYATEDSWNFDDEGRKKDESESASDLSSLSDAESDEDDDAADMEV